MEQKPFRLFRTLRHTLNDQDTGLIFSLAVLLGLLALSAVILWGNRRVIRHIRQMTMRPGQKHRLAFYTRFISFFLTIVLLSLAAGLMTLFWFPDIFDWLASHLDKPLAFVLRQAIIILAFLGIWETSYYFLRRKLGYQGNFSARAQTLMPVASNTIAIVLIVIYGLIFLSAIGVDIAPLLTGAGVAGIAIGLGAQQTIRDLIAGFTIIIEDLVQVGDVIVIGTHGGMVERITIRKIQLRDYNGSVYTVPYSEVKIIENMTKGFSMWVFELDVDYDTDIKKALDLIAEVGKEMRADPVIGPLMLADIEVAGLDAIKEYALRLKGRIQTKPIQQWTVGREFNRRIFERFRDEGIVMPFPIQELTLGSKETNALTAFQERIHASAQSVESPLS